MPYRRRRYARRNRRFNRFRRNRGNTSSATWQIAKRAARSLLKWYVNPEYKKLDQAFSAVAISTTASKTLLNGMAQGDTLTTRDGNRIRMLGLYGCLDFTQNSSATQTFLRIIIVLDKQANAALFGSGVLLTNDAVTEVWNPNTAQRFIRLFDKSISLSINGSSARQVRFKIKLGQHVFYSANNGTIADIQTNALVIYMVSSEATNAPAVTGNIRLTFLDN